MSSTSSKRTESFTARVLMAVAAFGLILFAGACGDSANGDNNNNNNNSPLPSTAKYEGFCTEFQECSTQAFNTAYDSVDQCASIHASQYNFGLSGAANVSQSCRNAVSSFFTCFFDSYQCSSGAWQQTGDCSSETNAIDQECPTSQ